MNLTSLALRRPFTVMVAISSVALASVLAVRRMPVDIFPDMGTPVIYVVQPYGGMDPAQMEGYLTNYTEFLFLLITGIHHVESKNIQSIALIKLHFHPGTNMAQAMAETVNYVNRARAWQPPGTVPPIVVRYDAGSVPVGYLVFSSETKNVGQIQDEATFRVRPLIASLPGVAAPPPFGGEARTIVLRLDPDRLRAYRIPPDEAVTALINGNVIAPSGNLHLGDQTPIVPVNSVVSRIQDLEKIPIRVEESKAVYFRDVGSVADSTDLPVGYALVNGRRSVFLPITKRADASTLSVVNHVKDNLPRMQAALSEDIQVRFEFDQSPFVTQAMSDVVKEGAFGAILTGLMVLLFLRDWRSVLVVILNIPLALMTALVTLWLCGQTINIMTLGGLALSVGILVDEATVAVENIHARMAGAPTSAWAILQGTSETTVPRLLAMLCILAVFIPSFFMEGAVQALFIPLSLAVGSAMVASYVLSSTFVPVLSVWLLRHAPKHDQEDRSLFARLQRLYGGMLERAMRFRLPLIAIYLAGATMVALGFGSQTGQSLFPAVDAGQFQLRLRAPEGTSLNRMEELTRDVLAAIEKEAGAGNVDISISLVGTASNNYPINFIYMWTAASHEALVRIALKPGSGIRVAELKDRLRQVLPHLERERAPSLKDVRLSFEAGDIVSEVMSFGSATPVEVAVSGPDLVANQAFARRIQDRMEGVSSLRDLQIVQSLNYPTVQVDVDRERAGLSGVTIRDISRSVLAGTSSSRYVVPNFWRDPRSGIGYQVQIELPHARMNSAADVEQIPIHTGQDSALLLRDVARIQEGTMPGQYDRYNMRRLVSLSADYHDEDLGNVGRKVSKAIEAAGEPPRGVTVDVRGQVVPMNDMFRGLYAGLAVTVVVIFLLLTAYFQSIRLALVTVSAVPAVLAGAALALYLTGTTLNIQSFMGTIMAIGVALANAILLVTFSERARVSGQSAGAAAATGAVGRLRPILMTSCAMIAGMVPMALALGEGGEQTAPLGRAVIGGLLAATLTTLGILPLAFALIQGRAATGSASLDPTDAASRLFVPIPSRPSKPTLGQAEG